MRDSSLAKRYALGLIKAIDNEAEYLRIEAELQAFIEISNNNSAFKAGMETLLFSKTQKEDFLQTLCRDVEFSEKTLHFLETMAEENRLILLDPVVSLLQNLWLEKNGIEKVKVFSVVPLGLELEKKLTQKLEESLGKKIILEQSIDESLIAGIKIQRGSIFYDFSLQGNLKKLKAAILADLPAAKNTFKGVLYAD